MSRTKDFLMWLEEKGHIHWNENTESYEWEGNDPMHDSTLLADYRRTNDRTKKSNPRRS